MLQPVRIVFVRVVPPLVPKPPAALFSLQACDARKIGRFEDIFHFEGDVQIPLGFDPYLAVQIFSELIDPFEQKADFVFVFRWHQIVADGFSQF